MAAVMAAMPPPTSIAELEVAAATRRDPAAVAVRLLWTAMNALGSTLQRLVLSSEDLSLAPSRNTASPATIKPWRNAADRQADPPPHLPCFDRWQLVSRQPSPPGSATRPRIAPELLRRCQQCADRALDSFPPGATPSGKPSPPPPGECGKSPPTGFWWSG